MTAPLDLAAVRAVAVRVTSRAISYPECSGPYVCWHCDAIDLARAVERLAAGVEASTALVCPRDQHTAGCRCDCWTCKQREAALAALRGEGGANPNDAGG